MHPPFQGKRVCFYGNLLVKGHLSSRFWQGFGTLLMGSRDWGVCFWKPLARLEIDICMCPPACGRCCSPGSFKDLKWIFWSVWMHIQSVRSQRLATSDTVLRSRQELSVWEKQQFTGLSVYVWACVHFPKRLTEEGVFQDQRCRVHTFTRKKHSSVTWSWMRFTCRSNSAKSTTPVGTCSRQTGTR